MEHQTFDRLTRRVGTAASRRTAVRTLLAGALLGATTRRAAAAPCITDTSGRCTCGESKVCAPGKCFVRCVDDKEFCCTGEFIVCGNTCCLDDGSDDPCKAPGCSRGGPRGGAGEACLEGITGSYRRR